MAWQNSVNTQAAACPGQMMPGSRRLFIPDEEELQTSLETLNHRLAVVRDRVRGVAMGLHAGFYLFGRAGTSKTYTVLNTLAQDGTPHFYHDGHLTPMGVFDLLAEQHDRVIVLDDVSAIFEQRIGLQILLAALGNQPDQPGIRIVKYRRQGEMHTVRFTGGIICISNLELHPTPLLRALKSRVHYLRFDPSNDQMMALMLDIASRGCSVKDENVSSAECREIALFLIEESTRLQCPLDIRLLVDKAVPDYVQYRNGDAEVHWKDLIRTTLEEQLVDLKHTAENGQSRAERKAEEHRIVTEILHQHATRRDQKAAWKRQTGKSDRAFERRLRELETM